MKTSHPHLFKQPLIILSATFSVLLFAACASSSTSEPTKETASTAGKIDSGFKRTSKLEKVWVAENFDFNGYDLLHIAPVESSQIKPRDEKETERLEMIKRSIPKDLAIVLGNKNIFPKVVTESLPAPDAKALKLQSEIIEFTRGSSAARYTVGFGAGSPRVRLHGIMTEAASGLKVFEFEINETGDWVGAGFTSNKTLQGGASQELAEKVGEFIQKVARHEPIRYK
jgi:hypothetical protein